MSENSLFFKKTESGVYFFYGEVLLFYHEKANNSYFITITENNNKEFPLKEVIVIQNKKNDFTLECKNNGKQINVRVFEQSEGKIKFIFDNYKEYSDFSFSLCKDITDTVLHVSTLQQENEEIYTEKKISYTLKNKYYFENEDIKNFDFEINNFIKIKCYQKSANFVLDFEKNIEKIKEEKKTEEINGVIYKKRKVFFTQDYIKNGNPPYLPDGIVGYTEEDKVYKKEKGVSLIGVIPTAFEKNNYLIRYFGDGELICEDNVMKIDFSAFGAKESFKTVLRKYFDDVDADGFFIGLEDYSGEEIIIIKEAVREIFEEYPLFLKKAIFFDKVSPVNDYFGYYIINDMRKTAKDKEYASYYKYMGEYLLGARVETIEDIENVSDCCTVVIVGK